MADLQRYAIVGFGDACYEFEPDETGNVYLCADADALLDGWRQAFPDMTPAKAKEIFDLCFDERAELIEAAEKDEGRIEELEKQRNLYHESVLELGARIALLEEVAEKAREVIRDRIGYADPSMERDIYQLRKALAKLDPPDLPLSKENERSE